MEVLTDKFTFNKNYDPVTVFRFHQYCNRNCKIAPVFPIVRRSQVLFLQKT